jgi:hypothetical protein
MTTLCIRVSSEGEPNMNYYIYCTFTTAWWNPDFHYKIASLGIVLMKDKVRLASRICSSCPVSAHEGQKWVC